MKSAKLVTTRIAVRVQPNAKCNQVDGFVADGEEKVLRVRCTSPPEDGKANKAVQMLVADALSMPKTQVSLVAGLKSRNKVLEIQGKSFDEIQNLISESS